MKELRTLLSLVILSLFAMSPVFSQDDIIIYEDSNDARIIKLPVAEKDTIKCGKSETLDWTGSNEECVIATSPRQAKIKFRKKISKRFTCSAEDCFDPEVSVCELNDIELPDLTENHGRYCINAKITISCTTCLDTSSVTSADPNLYFQTDPTGYEEEIIDLEPNSLDKPSTLPQGRLTTLYPNPTTGQVTVELDLGNASAEKIELLVTNLNGKQMKYSKFEDVTNTSFKQEMNLSDLSKGIYFISASIDGQPAGQNKIILQ